MLRFDSPSCCDRDGESDDVDQEPLKKITSGLFYRFNNGFSSAYLYIEYAYCDDNDVEYVCLPLQNQQNWQQCRKDRHPVTKNFVDAMIASLCVYRELATALFSIFLVEALQRYPVKA